MNRCCYNRVILFMSERNAVESKRRDTTTVRNTTLSCGEFCCPDMSYLPVIQIGRFKVRVGVLKLLVLVSKLLNSLILYVLYSSITNLILASKSKANFCLFLIKQITGYSHYYFLMLRTAVLLLHVLYITYRRVCVCVCVCM
jgi:hypothetical protein